MKTIIIKFTNNQISKLFIIILSNLLIISSIFAQSPEKMNYQVVIRDLNNNLLTNTWIAMQISILQGSTSGTAVYVETQTPATNANGLVSIEIGGGIVVSGNFSTINWANGPYFVKTEIDLDGSVGGLVYTIAATSQLVSVPYALHAKTAETVTNETDPLFVASPANGITSGDIINWNNKLEVEQDSSVANEIQVLSISNDTVYLSKAGGFVKLPPAFINLTTAQMIAIVTPSAGLMVYNTTLKKPLYYDGTEWKNMDGTKAIY